MGIWMVFAGILLHGICYDFFFVTGMVYADKAAPEGVRGQAQGFLVLITQGLGLGLGAQAFQRLVGYSTSPAGGVDWVQIWLWPAGFAFAVLAVFVMTFWDRTGSSGDRVES